MKAVIFFSGLAGLLIFGPPFFKSRAHHHDVTVVVRESPAREAVRIREAPRQESSWEGQARCRFEAERRLASSASGVRELLLEAGSGSLEVRGVTGLREIQAVARACASREEFLEDLQLTAETSGSVFRLQARYPEWQGWTGGDRYARLDLVVQVPDGMAAEILDGAGAMEVSELGSVSIRDGSGEVRVEGIRGDLIIRDGSGELEIRGVSGFVEIQDGSGEILLQDVGADVEIQDSSGEVEIQGVAGSVILSDSSGELDVRDVLGSVHVLRDSSGDIRVRGVGQDFVVDRDGSGKIEHEGVAGRIDVPRKNRDR